MINIEDTPEYQKGLLGEKEIVKILQDNGAYVIPQYNYKQSGEFKGPCIGGSKDEYVLPDVEVFTKNGHRIWVEVKTKEIRSLHYTTNTWVHGFNLRHYKHYMKIQSITGKAVWVVFLERGGTHPGSLLCCHLKTTPIHHRYEGDRMGKDGMVFFDVNALKPFSELINLLKENKISDKKSKCRDISDRKEQPLFGPGGMFS
jgi:hypothetical protein